MQKDYYSQLIAELKKSGIDSELSNDIAVLICNDDSFDDKTPAAVKQEAYKDVMTKVKKAIQSTLINA